MLEFMEIASDWGDRNDIPMLFYRSTEDLRWKVRLEYKPGYCLHVLVFQPRKKNKGMPAETGEEYHSRIERTFSRAIAEDRTKSIREYTQANPQGRVA